MYTPIGPMRPQWFEPLLALSTHLDLAPGPGGSRMSDFAVTRALYEPVLHGVFYAIHQITVIALYPSAQLVAHCDPPIKGSRYHLPLQVNPDCWVFHDGMWQQLEAGRWYQMDPTKLHGAVNWGSEVRLHLIVDVA